MVALITFRKTSAAFSNSTVVLVRSTSMLGEEMGRPSHSIVGKQHCLAQFDLEDRRRRSLLLASVSESVGRAQQALGNLALQPASVSESAARRPQPLALPLPMPLKKALSKLPRPKHRPGEHGKAAHQHLGRAGADLHRAVAVFAGVLIAGVAQAAKQLVATRPVGQRRDTFHDSFRLPWKFERGGAKK